MRTDAVLSFQGFLKPAVCQEPCGGRGESCSQNRIIAIPGYSTEGLTCARRHSNPSAWIISFNSAISLAGGYLIIPPFYRLEL